MFVTAKSQLTANTEYQIDISGDSADIYIKCDPSVTYTISETLNEVVNGATTNVFSSLGTLSLIFRLTQEDVRPLFTIYIAVNTTSNVYILANGGNPDITISAV